MRILVSGGAGFIGTNVCRDLTEHGHEVRAVDDFSTGSVENTVGADYSVVDLDILDDSLAHHVGWSEAVIHLAAIPSVPRSIAAPLPSHEVNATGTLRLLVHATNAPEPPHVVVASSSSVYGANPTLPKREDMVCQPMSPYAVSKLATEQYAMAWQRSYGLDTLAFRFFNVFGPYQAPGHAYAAVVPAFLDAALSDTPVNIHGDGTQSRDFTYVGTVAQVLRHAVERRVTHNTPVNLAFGTRVTLLDLLEEIESQLGRRVERDHGPARVGDVPHSQADNSLLRSLFSDVAPVDLPTGLKQTIDWFRSRA
jgi:UDP-glucose 4-epimerase